MLPRVIVEPVSVVLAPRVTGLLSVIALPGLRRLLARLIPSADAARLIPASPDPVITPVTVMLPAGDWIVVGSRKVTAPIVIAPD